VSQGEQRPALLLQRNFAALWWGQLISLLGDRLTYLALGGLLLQHTHRGSDEHYPVLLALLGNVMAAPVLLFSPFTGAWVDRMDLKRVLIVSDLLRAIVVLAVPWTYALTGHTGTTFVLVFLLFTCNVFFLPAKSAITPEIVPPGELLAANSLLSVAGIAATAIGALGGGWVVDHWGWSAAMQIDALTYLVSVGTIAAVRYRPAGRRATVVPESARHYLREVREGWATVRDNPHVGLGLTALAAVWIGGGFLHVAGNQHIQQVASVPGMERVGVLLFVLGLGAGLGTWFVSTRGRSWPRPVLLGVGLILAGLGLVAFAVTRRFAVFTIAAFLIGTFAAPAFVLTETLLQEGTALLQRGRIFSLRDFLMRFAFIISVGVAGWLSRALGGEPTLLVAAGCLVVVGALSLGWGRRHPDLMRVPQRP
jgi:predicted MFS family arabinose efflux permease